LTKGQEGLQRLLQLDEIDDMPASLLNLLSKMLDVNVEHRYFMEDVLAHPWLNLNPDITKQSMAKGKLPSPQTEHKKLPPSSSPSLPTSSSPLPTPAVSPVRPTRHANITSLLTSTPTAKSISPTTFRYAAPFGEPHHTSSEHSSTTIPETSRSGPEEGGTKEEGEEFADVQLFETPHNTHRPCTAAESSVLAIKKQKQQLQTTVLYRSQTEPEQPPITMVKQSSIVVTSDNKEVRVRAVSFGTVG
jgi:serine/threonine protein kinase